VKCVHEYKAERDAEFARHLNEFFKQSGRWYPQLEEELDAGQVNSGTPGQKLNEEATYDRCHNEHPNLGQDPALKQKRAEQRNAKRWPRIDCDELPSKQFDERTGEKDIQLSFYKINNWSECQNPPGNAHRNIYRKIDPIESAVANRWKKYQRMQENWHIHASDSTVPVLNEGGVTLTTKNSMSTRACMSEMPDISDVDGTCSVSR
jgi:hypothetical protein